MASLYKTAAAVCLVALYGLRSEATNQTTYKFKAFKVEDAGYLAANLVRNGKLPVHISEVSKDDGLVSTLTRKVELKGIDKQTDEATDDTCKELVEALSLKDIFHLSFDYTDSPNYRELLQKALDAGIKVFPEEYFTGLIARTAKLTEMTDEDLKAPSNDSTAAAAIPTILSASLFAMLTALST
ncbi:hypothetical protein EBH_0027790 [Eimeria brunetti]|uniref:SAG family member n=1 Tax=Eimeria brunetti TaxID=51314 RepID=U6L5F4_9EIME|nr:hypothetical protein EBH_0027790 [Eimeria brunetti]